MPLTPGSPAIDAGALANDGTSPPQSHPNTDQRGFVPRLENKRIDIGAFERADANPDNDDDMLPDTWESQYGLDPNSGAEDNGTTGNFDGDRSSNYQEYVAGSHPGDAQSEFDLWAKWDSEANVSVIEFEGRSDRVYRLSYSSETASSDWHTLRDDIAGTDGLISIVDTNMAPYRRYRADVRLK